MTTPIRLAVIDDHPLFREGVIRTLSEIGGFEVVGEGGTSEDALLLAGEKPDIVVLDISIPGNGLSAIGHILERHPAQKIVVLTVSEASDDITKALNSGAKGYVAKSVGSRGLAEALRTVAAGESYLSPTLAVRLLSELSALSGASSKPNPIAELSSREKEILTLVASGLSNKHVAARLDIEEKTVKHHMTRVLDKLNVRNRTQAALLLRDSTGNLPSRP